MVSSGRKQTQCRSCCSFSLLSVSLPELFILCERDDVNHSTHRRNRNEPQYCCSSWAHDSVSVFADRKKIFAACTEWTCCAHCVLGHSDDFVMVEAEALHGICRSNLYVERPTSTNMSRLLVQIISSTRRHGRFQLRWKTSWFEPSRVRKNKNTRKQL